MKQLIINADDFGFTKDVNAGIIQAHREGVLTAATLMANGDAFEDAVRLARETPTLDVGCHLVLIQGEALTTGQAFPETPLQAVSGIFRRTKFDIYSELRAQIQKIIAAGIRPSHLDSHKHAHIMPHIFRVVIRLAQEFGIPFVRLPLDRTAPFAGVPCRVAGPVYRGMARRRGVRMTDNFLGYRLTGTLTEATLLAALASLPEGLTEFMCHPGYLGSELQSAATRLKESRLRELEALMSPRVREYLASEHIALTRYQVMRSHSGKFVHSER